MLYEQHRAMLEGSLAQALLEGICAHITGSAVYLVLIGITAVVTSGRYALTLQFRRRAAGLQGARAGSPEGWAWRFVIGNCVTSAVFCLNTIYTCFAFRDASLKLLVILVQGAWLAGSTQRNAPSPAAVLAQTALISTATVIGAAFGGSPILYWLIPFVLAHAASARGGVGFFGDLHLSTLLNEQRLRAANVLLTQQSATDGLTGIGNRRAFDTVLAKEVRRASRNADSLALIMIDVDYFKDYNDRYGHSAGDDCLRRVAAFIEGAVRRPPDFAARFGGEEFCVLLPSTQLDGARNVAETIRAAINAARIPHASSPIGHVTVSLGVSCLIPPTGFNEADLVGMADLALYRAKETGRNTVCDAAPSERDSLKLNNPLP
jgi:diguanylate cyclase (GGDEF)-like protein